MPLCRCNEARGGFVLTLYFLHLLPSLPYFFFTPPPSLPCPLSSPLLCTVPLLSLISSSFKLSSCTSHLLFFLSLLSFPHSLPETPLILSHIFLMCSTPFLSPLPSLSSYLLCPPLTSTSLTYPVLFSPIPFPPPDFLSSSPLLLPGGPTL